MGTESNGCQCQRMSQTDCRKNREPQDAELDEIRREKKRAALAIAIAIEDKKSKENAKPEEVGTTFEPVEGYLKRTKEGYTVWPIQEYEQGRNGGKTK